MSWKVKTYYLKSSCPMIIHNGQTADQMNRFTLALKEVSKKKSKTETDYAEMSHIEFMASLYMGEKGPVIPAANLEATIINAAKRFKEGPQAKAGMYVKNNAYIIYDGPKDPEKMFRDDRFRDVRAVVIQRSRVMRTRVIFSEWEAKVDVCFEDGVTNESRVNEWMSAAGSLIGLCEMRPRYGRFEIVNK